jgi:hypothetical protein
MAAKISWHSSDGKREFGKVWSALKCHTVDLTNVSTWMLSENHFSIAAG